MRGNGQRPTPSILLDSCFELNWLASAVRNRCSRSQPIDLHIQDHACGLECINSTSIPTTLRVPVLKQALAAGSQLQQLASRQRATAQSRHVVKIIHAWIWEAMGSALLHQYYWTAVSIGSHQHCCWHFWGNYFQTALYEKVFHIFEAVKSIDKTMFRTFFYSISVIEI